MASDTAAPGHDHDDRQRRRLHPLALGVAVVAVSAVGAGAGLVYTALARPGTNQADPSLQVLRSGVEEGATLSGSGHAHHEDIEGVSLRGVAFTDLDGAPASFDDYLGTPLVVNFWQSTCPPCIEEMPALEQVHRELAGEVAFLGIAVREPVADSLRMIESTGVTYDIGRDDGGLMVELGAFGMPSSVFVTAEGDVLHVAVGALTVDEIRAHVDHLLR